MSLRDALLKAGKISKKDAQKAATAERRRRKKKKGHKLDAQREADSQARHDQRMEAQRAADRARAEEQKRAFEAHERMVRVRNTIQGGRREPGRRRGSAWHFVRSNGRIGRLDLDAELALELQYGAAAVVELPESDDVVVVSRKTALKLLDLAPEVVKFYIGVDAPDDPLVNPPVLE